MNQEEKLLKEWCKTNNVDYVLAKALSRKILPLLAEARRRCGDTFDRVLLEQKRGTEIRLSNSERLRRILHNKLDPNKFSHGEVRAISLHIEFLMMVEGFFATQINFLIFTLIANGHDFYSVRNGRYAKTFGEIEKEDLAYKMKFLKEHNFTELVKNEKRIRNLRNSIAHVFYEIESNGDVKIGKETISEKNYDEYYGYLRDIANIIHYIQTRYYQIFMDSLSPEEKGRLTHVKLDKIKCSCGYENLLPQDRIIRGQQFRCTNCNKPI